MSANLSCPEYCSTGHRLSSQSIQRFSTEPGVFYALGMEPLQPFGFGERLSQARKERGLTGSELGAGLADDGSDVTRQSVSAWEKERHYPKANQLRVICERLQVSADYLLFGSPLRISPAVMAIAKEAQALTPEQKAQVVQLLNAPGVTDATVEAKMPIAKALQPRKPARKEGT